MPTFAPRYAALTSLSCPACSPARQRNLCGLADWRMVSEAFGKTFVDQTLAPTATSTTTNNFRFPGQYEDPETGTHYNYFRDYDPSTGRYVQSDPIGQRGGLNLYLYVLNDPLGSVDEDGLKPRPPGTGGNSSQRRFDRRHPQPQPPRPSPGGDNSLGESAGYYNMDGEYICLRWSCPTNPNMCSPNDTKSYADFIPVATDPQAPPKGCVCDEPRFRLPNNPNYKGPSDYLELLIRRAYRAK